MRAEIWDWRENVKAGVRVYKDKAKAKTAKPYVEQCAKSSAFKALVEAYNKARQADNKVPLRNIGLAAFATIASDWLEEDAIRGFNGYGGVDSLGQPAQVHEFEVPLGAC